MDTRKNPAWLKGKKVAIVTDWLTTYGGAEKVVKTLHEIFPEAPILTSQYSKKDIDWFDDCDVRTGWLNIFPAKLRKFLGPLRVIYFSNLKLGEFDVIISSCIAESKGIKTREDQLHISYLQGPPTQYYWGMYDDYVKNPGFGKLNGIVRFFFKLLVKPLRDNDYQLSKRPDYIIANSTYSAKEVETYYHRQAAVVFPPVDVDKFRPSAKTSDFYISTSRQVNWKRLDLAVEAFRDLDAKLILVGGGAEHDKLVALAAGSANIEFVPTINDSKELAQLVSKAKAFIFPSLEPFGIAPIEALSAGVPVIAYKKGGVLDYVIENKNGVFFPEQTAESLKKAVLLFEKKRFNKKEVSATAKSFSKDNFKKTIEQFIKEKVDEKN